MHWERLDETVKVRADFAGGTILPVAFRRGELQVRIKSINTRWQDARGQSRRCYFAVTADSGDVYQLCFDTADLSWKLEYVMYDG